LSGNNGIALNSGVPDPPSDALCFDVGAMRFAIAPYAARWDGRRRPARLPRPTGRRKPTHEENAADDASRSVLRLRSSGSVSVGITVALSDLRQDCDHEGLDPRGGLRRREDQRGRARGRFTSERPRILAGAQPQGAISGAHCALSCRAAQRPAGVGKLFSCATRPVALLIAALYCIVAGGLRGGAAVPTHPRS
jgi:hypothetical protein